MSKTHGHFSQVSIPWLTLACGLSVGLFTSQNATAAIYTTGSFQLLGTGLDSSLFSDPNQSSGGLQIGIDGKLALFGTQELTSYTGSTDVSLVKLVSHATIQTSRGSLGIIIEGDATHLFGQFSTAFPAFAGGTAQVTWDDGITVFSKTGGKLPFHELLVNYVIDGQLNVERLGDASLRGGVDVAAQFWSPSFGKWQRNTWDIGNGMLQIASGVGYHMPLDENGSGHFYTVLTVNAQIAAPSTGSGSAEARLGHTMRLVSVTFPDGSTPESHGFEVIFDSGIESPNLTVPEPASCIIWLLAGGLGLWRRRRNRGMQLSEIHQS